MFKPVWADCDTLISYPVLYFQYNSLLRRSCYLLTLELPSYFIETWKLCLADAIHNFKWVKIIQIWQNGGQLFLNHADWCHNLLLTIKKSDI